MKTKSDLAKLFEKYLYAANELKKSAFVSEIIEEVFSNGFDAESIQFFATKFKKDKKQTLIKDIFQELENADKFYEVKILNTLTSFLLETTLLIQDQILPVYFENFQAESDFRIVFKTEQIFVDHWDNFSDKLKKRVFREFLTVLENPLDFFIEEGVYEILKIILKSKASGEYETDLFTMQELENLVKKLIKVAKKKKKDTLYAVFESIKRILREYPSLVSQEIYDLLYPFFRKFKYRIAYFYPARRRYIKMGVSFLELMLLFEPKFCDSDYIQYMNSILGKMAKKVDHADVRNFLQLILTILKKSEHMPILKIINPALEVLKEVTQKKERLDTYTNELLREIFDIIWPHLPEEQKSEFFDTITPENSRI
ncbi:MAG: hypothetical protein R6U96_08590 [Promethearchaeia archaeon]